MSSTFHLTRPLLLPGQRVRMATLGVDCCCLVQSSCLSQGAAKLEQTD